MTDDHLKLFVGEGHKGKTWPMRGCARCYGLRKLVGQGPFSWPTGEPVGSVLCDLVPTEVVGYYPGRRKFDDDGNQMYQQRSTPVVRYGSHLLYLPAADGHHKPASAMLDRYLEVWNDFPGSAIYTDYSRLSTEQVLVPFLRDYCNTEVVLLRFDVPRDIAEHWSTIRQVNGSRAGRRISNETGHLHSEFNSRLRGLDPVMDRVRVRALRHDHAVQDLYNVLHELGALP